MGFVGIWLYMYLAQIGAVNERHVPCPDSRINPDGPQSQTTAHQFMLGGGQDRGSFSRVQVIMCHPENYKRGGYGVCRIAVLSAHVVGCFAWKLSKA